MRRTRSTLPPDVSVMAISGWAFANDGLDLREGGQEAARVADVQLVTSRLCGQRGGQAASGDGERERGDAAAAQNATSIDATTVRGEPRWAV